MATTYFCKCGWQLPELALDVEYAPGAQQASHFRVMVCCPVCDVFIQVAIDVAPPEDDWKLTPQ